MAAALIADIGGTTSRFALAEDGRLGPLVRLPNDAYGSPEQLVEDALAGLAAKSAATAAVFAVAGPIGDSDVALTNRPWTIRRDGLARVCGVERLILVNDFEAVGHALPALGEDDVKTLAEGAPSPAGPKLVLGPGTGLGAAVWWPGEPARVTATEAGHMSFGASAADEEAVFAALRAGLGWVSAETVLSGPGLARLHAALSADGTETSAAAVAALLDEGDGQGKATMALFARLMGRFAGDLALACRASGGVFLAGGVFQKLQEHIDRDILLAAFAAHPPYQDWLRQVPVHVILAEEPGLIGCAAIAQRLTA